MAKTIVTVDDAATMRKLIAFTLKGAGHNVLEAPDGMAALSALNSQTVDLVITDINMPKMDGFELIEAVRAVSGFRGTPILVLSTEFSDEKKARARSAGATGWIVKPFQPDQLISIVARVLGA